MGISETEISTLYAARFSGRADYRAAIWRLILRHVMQPWLEGAQRVLDVGAGYGEFINAVQARERHAIDLNPDTGDRLSRGVLWHRQNSSDPWPLAGGSLDLVFSSNFLEHLPSKEEVSRTLEQAFRSLRSGGKLILMGPNIRFLAGAYWDFWDHHVPLSDRSLSELLKLQGFAITFTRPRFLPYTMSQGFTPPLWMVRAYLRLPWAWHLF